MEEPRSTAGQGLGIAGLVLGILAIPMGIIPCTFYVGIIFGLIGIILSLVALSQANRGYGPKTLIIAALICSIVGLTFASVWGFTLSRNGARVVKEIIREGIRDGDLRDFEDFDAEEGIIIDEEEDTTEYAFPDRDIGDMTDTLKALEGEQDNP
jgi:hypothetical protein